MPVLKIICKTTDCFGKRKIDKRKQRAGYLVQLKNILITIAYVIKHATT